MSVGNRTMYGCVTKHEDPHLNLIILIRLMFGDQGINSESIVCLAEALVGISERHTLLA